LLDPHCYVEKDGDGDVRLSGLLCFFTEGRGRDGD
jgi:hypothetical protein